MPKKPNHEDKLMEDALSEAAEVAPQPVPEPTPPPVLAPTKISKEDILDLENMQLKMENVQLQLQIMQGDLQKAMGEREKLVVRMKAKRDAMLVKYGVDVAQVAIADDGTVTPHNVKFPGMQ